MTPGPAETTTFAAIGTTATVVTAGGDHRAAVRAVQDDLEAVDLACSRFRDDSEVARVNAGPGVDHEASDLFIDVTEAALRAARLTGGLVDPTVGRALRLLGYDRDFAELPADGAPVTFVAAPVPGWRTVRVDRSRGTVRVGRGTELDFGSVAKALVADRAAAHAAAASGASVLVSLGGDIAVGGPVREGGWPVAVCENHADTPGPADPVVSITGGGLATSSTTVRRWSRGAAQLHHLIDPRSGRPVDSPWRTATTAAASALDANVASTAAILLGGDATEWLSERSIPARLVGRDGSVTTVGGWPEEPARRTGAAAEAEAVSR